MNRELAYWVATSAISGVGTVTFNFLLSHFKSLRKFWNAGDSEILKLKKLDSKTKESILSFRKNIDPKIYLSKVYEQGIKVVTSHERDYPANLRQTIGCPPVLYFKGTLLPQDDFAIAVVGSRYSTPYGRQVTEKFVSDLSGNGLTIVSGLAKGIDSVAHKTALENGGRTIAVLGCGLDIVYPAENKNLADAIVKNGALVSEFPLGFPPLQNNFAARNRIISGMSIGVLVTEAAAESGSLITAGYAAEQSREVFAVPGPITSRTSEGVNKLLKEGVHPVTDKKDILEILGILENGTKKVTKSLEKPKDKDQAQVLEILDGESKHIDQIAREANLPVEKITSALSFLEISGYVKNYGLGIWGK